MTTENPFSLLENERSSPTDSASPTPSQYRLSFAEPTSCEQTICGSSTSLLLPSVPTTPTKPPNVKVPGSDPEEPPAWLGTTIVCGRHERHDTEGHRSLLDHSIPSPYLYRRASREALLGLDDRSVDLAKSFAIACGQDVPDPDFTSYKEDPKDWKVAVYHTEEPRTIQPMLYDEYTFIGAALPNMSRAVPTKTGLARVSDASFYKHTRPYLKNCSRSASQFSTVAEYPVRNGADTLATNEETKPASITTANTLLKPDPTSMQKYFGDCTLGPAQISSPTGHRRHGKSDQPWLWEPDTLPWLKQQAYLPKLISPKIEQASACRKSLILPYRKSVDRRFERTTNSWGESKTEPGNLSTTRSGAALLVDAKAATDAFENIMNYAPPKLKETTMPTSLQTLSDCVLDIHPLPKFSPPLPTTASSLAPNGTRKRPIYDAAVRSAAVSDKTSQLEKTIDLAACPTPACSALVPAKLYQHQYLGWPGELAHEDVIYQDKTWLTIGAYIAHLQKDKRCTDSSKVSLCGTTAEAGSRIQKEVDLISADLGLDAEHAKGCRYTDAWRDALPRKSDAQTSISEYGLSLLFEKESEFTGVKIAATENLEDEIRSSSSGSEWTDIGEGVDSEHDWDWSEDELCV